MSQQKRDKVPVPLSLVIPIVVVDFLDDRGLCGVCILVFSVKRYDRCQDDENENHKKMFSEIPTAKTMAHFPSPFFGTNFI